MDHNLEDKVGFSGWSDVRQVETVYDAEEHEVHIKVGVHSVIIRWNIGLFQGNEFRITRYKLFVGREKSEKGVGRLFKGFKI